MAWVSSCRQPNWLDRQYKDHSILEIPASVHAIANLKRVKSPFVQQQLQCLVKTVAHGPDLLITLADLHAIWSTDARLDDARCVIWYDQLCEAQTSRDAMRNGSRWGKLRTEQIESLNRNLIQPAKGDTIEEPQQ